MMFAAAHVGNQDPPINQNASSVRSKQMRIFMIKEITHETICTGYVDNPVAT